MEDASNNQRSIIFFLLKENREGAEIHQRLENVFGDRAVSKKTVYNWIEKLKQGRDSLEDDSRSGRPSTSVNQHSIARVEELLEEDRRLTVSDIAEKVYISEGSAHTILHERLGLRWVSARWVPKLLAPEQKLERVRVCSSLQFLLEEYGENFWRRIVTTDETWLPYYNSETKAQSMSWVKPGETPPVKAKATPSAGKVMMTVFWDCEGLIEISYLPRGETINADYYIEQLNRLHAALKKSRPGKLHQRILLQHDNARPHTAKKTIAALREKNWELLPHPPYSPDLAPSDFWLFGPLKSGLRGKKYETLKAIQSDVKKWFLAQDKDWFKRGIQSLEKRWEKCVERDGDYVEKS